MDLHARTATAKTVGEDALADKGSMSDPGTCPHCKGPVKPLFTGFFCPKDCDRPEARLRNLQNAIAGAQDVAVKPRIYVPYRGGWPVAGTGSAYAPADDQCRDGMCRGQGKYTHTSYTNLGTAASTKTTFYDCTICQKSWGITDPTWPASPAATP